VKEEVHAIVSRRGRHHPLTQQVLGSAGVSI
jgi:LysR family transcriptional regulator, transcriptional activator of nhaA